MQTHFKISNFVNNNHAVIMKLLRNTLLLLPVLIFLTSNLSAQKQVSSRQPQTPFAGSAPEISYQPGLDYPDYPLLILPESYRGRQLPSSVDNSALPYMRPVFMQQGASCGQAASVGYDFCYEIDRVRDLPADTSINQYPTHFTWNFTSTDDGMVGGGVSYFRTFEILRSYGCPNEADFGPITMDDDYYWMSGYDKYLAAMHNRIRMVNSINVGTPEGLLTLKHWLNDHLEGSATGGLANFYTGYGSVIPLPANTPEAGKGVITNWTSPAVHALTIVGYNDSIRYDINKDGLFTNDIDINSDGIVDLKDWEIGGYKIVNSYGEDWANFGYSYALYRSLALDYGDGGIWNNAAHVVTVEPDYAPLLTMKIKISHNKRGRIRVRAGISADTSSAYPETITGFSIFNFQGGDYYMCGGNRAADKELEFGLDITPLIGAMKTGAPSRVFLLIDEKDPDNTAEGDVSQFSVISYLNDTIEYNCGDAPSPIVNNSETMFSVVLPGNFPVPVITPEYLPAAVAGFPYSQHLTASSGYPPYKWQIQETYTTAISQADYVPGQGQLLSFPNTASGIAVCKLPFEFPFYGEKYDTIRVQTDGYLFLENIEAPYPYVQDESLYLSQIKAISPYMNRFQQITAAGTGVWFEADASHAVFTWKVDGESCDTTKSDNFKATLYPDGKIEFSYGALDIPLTQGAIAGISNGDGLNFQFGDPDFVAPSALYSLIPEKLPGGLAISPDGVISSDTVQGDFSAKMTVAVTDSRNIHCVKPYTLSTGPIVETSIRSGEDTVMEPGEEAVMSLLIHNLTSGNVHNLELRLQSLSPLVAISDSTEECSDIPNGLDLNLADAFRFRVPEAGSQGRDLNFKLRLAWDNHSAEQLLTYSQALQEYAFSGPLIIDGNNKRLDAGESCKLIFRVTYGGAPPEDTIMGNIYTDDPYVSVSETSLVPFLNPGGHSSYKLAEWNVKANPHTPPGRLVKFSFEGIPGKGDTMHETFNLGIGKTPVAVIDLDGNKNSGRHIIASMEKLNVNPDQLYFIDSAICDYDNLFLCLGTKPIANYHVLTDEEGAFLDYFLSQGNNLYMEGGATFGYDKQLPVHEKFSVKGKKLAWPYPADSIAGDSSTFAEGIHFIYKGDNLMTDNLNPLDSAISIFTDENTHYHFTVINDACSYRTIASSIEFGGFYPYGGSTREEIMKHYLDFFGYNSQSLAANFVTDHYTTCAGTSMEFRPNCAGSPLTYHWTFEGGIPSGSEDQNAYVRWDEPGIYDVSLIVTDSVTSDTLVREGLITVLDCSSIPEETVAFELNAYPNPVSQQLYLRANTNCPGFYELSLTDLVGRNMLSGEAFFPAGISVYPVDVSGMKKGVYILVLRNNHTRLTRKIVVN